MMMSCVSLGLLGACGGDDGKVDVTITDADAALTAAGGDTLFDAEVKTADEVYDLDTLIVRYTPEEGDPIELAVELSTDADDDGKLGQGDVLTVSEPADNVFGTEAAGQTYSIAILTQGDGEEEPTELWSGSWDADPAQE
jgi:hypothetical protein